MEAELDGATAENLRLKALVFDLDFQVSSHAHELEQAQRKLKFFGDKQTRALRELEATASAQDQELRKTASELEQARKELEKTRREALVKLEDLRRLESGNQKVQAEKYDQRLEQLDAQLRDAEAARKEIQYRLEYAAAQWEVKLRLFAKEGEERARQTQAQLSRAKQLLEELRAKGRQEAELHSQRERLLKEQHENAERGDLVASYTREAEELAQLAREAERQRQEIAAEIGRVEQALAERLTKMNAQLDLLEAIRRERNDYKRELERLHYKVKDLSKHIDKYAQEVARLQEEKEALGDRVAELAALVGRREDEIAEMEGRLAEKERLAAQLEARLKAQQQAPKPVFALPKGDLLDEMIGQYIHQANCPVPIKKLGNGYYIFGTRKIYAKILNGKLVIRVGGGYMVIEEFISTYAEQELAKMNKLNEKTTDDEDGADVDSLDLTPASRGGSRRAASGRGANVKSPRSTMPNEKTFSAAVDYGLSGTHRSKKITQKALERIQHDPRAGRLIEQKDQ